MDDEPTYPNPFPVGTDVSASEHYFKNENGGTGIGGPIEARITKAWYDYECGWRYWAEPLDKKYPHRKIFVDMFVCSLK